jgi:hypothetical protein
MGRLSVAPDDRDSQFRALDFGRKVTFTLVTQIECSVLLLDQGSDEQRG